MEIDVVTSIDRSYEFVKWQLLVYGSNKAICI